MGSHQLLELDHATGSPMTCQILPRHRSARGVPEGRKRASAASSSTCQAVVRVRSCAAWEEVSSSWYVLSVVSVGCAVIVCIFLIRCCGAGLKIEHMFDTLGSCVGGDGVAAA